MTHASEAQQLLERRAVKLAQSPPEQTETSSVEAITLNVARRRYVLEVRHVSRITRPLHLCRLPADAGDLIGLVMVGGAAVPVADLGALLRLSEPNRSRPFVVLLAGVGPPLGLLVDEVESFGHVVEMGPDSPANAAEETRSFERGVVADGGVLLDADVLSTQTHESASRAMRQPPEQTSTRSHSIRHPGEPCED